MNKVFAYGMMFMLMIVSVCASVAPTSNIVVDSNTSVQYFNATTENWEWAVPAEKTNSAWDIITIPAKWVWRTIKVNPVEATDGSEVQFKKSFDIPQCAAIIGGSIDITADNAYNFSLNDELVGTDSGYLPGGSDTSWSTVKHYELTNLRNGNNVFAFNTSNLPQAGGNENSNPAGLIFSANIQYDDSDCGNDVPEFGFFAGAVALIGAMGLIFVSRKN